MIMSQAPEVETEFAAVMQELSAEASAGVCRSSKKEHRADARTLGNFGS